MKGYYTKKGIVFTTSQSIVFKGDGSVIAEPGDLMNQEFDLISNLSRAANGDSKAEVVHNLDDTIFVSVK